MPRTPRHFSPGSTYHVICRGNRQQPIFRVEDDYRYFLNLLGNVIERFDHDIIAYCLMTNHVHLAVRVGEESLSEIFHRVLFRYAQVFNVRNGLSGHLFQDRFKSKLVDSGPYMRSLIRYIHLNPVRAGLVHTAEDYPWTSHKAYLGRQEIPWLSKSLGLESFAKSSDGDLPTYHEAVSFDRDSGEWFDFDLLDSEVSLERLLAAVANEFGVSSGPVDWPSPNRKMSQARAAVALVAKRVRGPSFLELARVFHRDPSALSRAVSRMESKINDSVELEQRILKICRRLASG